MHYEALHLMSHAELRLERRFSPCLQFVVSIQAEKLNSQRMCARPNVKVIVTFLDDEPETAEIDGATKDLLALSGVWEDEHSAEAIIKDIYESRTRGKDEVEL